MNVARQSSYISEEEKNLLRALLYFDIFNYPLTADEISRFSPMPISSSPHQLLERLVSQKLLFQIQNFYSPQNDSQLAVRRTKGNALAAKKMKTARRISGLLFMFPFVRAVMLSGSISKNYMDENSDIDYFIVTETNRLWIVRTALVMFRRIFLFNSLKYLCTNYFVDIDNLEIREKNIFTAIELATVKPMFGKAVIEKFRVANHWAFSFLPNFSFDEMTVPEKKYLFKQAIEKFSPSKAADIFNQWLLNKSVARWKKRYTHKLHATDFEVAFRSTTGISKSHPQFYQKKVLALYDQKIKDFATKNGIDLSL